MADKQFDASDEESVRVRDKDVKVRESLRRDGLKHLLSAPNGRKWLYWLLEIAHTGGTSFRGEQPLLMSFLEGERNVGSQVLAEVLNYFPNEYQIMIKENQNV